MTMNIRRYLRGVVSVLAIFSAATAAALDTNDSGYFFDKEPYVNPRIIEELTGWLSDLGEQVVGINLVESMGTNRYFNNTQVSGEDKPVVFYQDTEACQNSTCPFGPPGFLYQLVGTTSSGVSVLFTESSGGGTGRFRNLLLVSLEKENGLSYDKQKNVLGMNRERWVLKKLLEIPLGDRYQGDISVKANSLYIGKDHYSHASGFFEEHTVITLETDR